MKQRIDFVAVAFWAVALMLGLVHRRALPDLVIELTWPGVEVGTLLRASALLAVVTLALFMARTGALASSALPSLRRSFAVLAISFVALPVSFPPGSWVATSAMIFSLLSVAYAHPSIVFSSGGLLPREGKARLAGPESGTNPRQANA